MLDAPAWLQAEERNREKAARLRDARDLVADVLEFQGGQTQDDLALLVLRVP